MRAKDPFTAQEDFFRTFTETCLECPACKGITLWGISDNNTWLDNTPPLMSSRPNRPLLHDEEIRPKSSYWGVLQALGLEK